MIILLSENGIVIRNIFAVERSGEDDAFLADITNRQLLFHCTFPHHLVGILSRYAILPYSIDLCCIVLIRVYRGLLPPNVVVEDLGGVRTDAGMLGSAIYFADSAKSAIFCLSRFSPFFIV